MEFVLYKEMSFIQGLFETSVDCNIEGVLNSGVSILLEEFHCVIICFCMFVENQYVE